MKPVTPFSYYVEIVAEPWKNSRKIAKMLHDVT